MKRTTLTLLVTLTLGSALPATQVLAAPEPLNDVSQASYTDAELDSLLAPVALYPDSILTHILIAATYPLEVVAADRWRQENQHLNAEQVAVQVDAFDWDPSVKALAPFEQVLRTMADDLNWLQALGDNVLISQSRVLARVQVLRQHALESGSLSDNEYQTVERDKEIIVIEPRRREVVYVPYYDTRVVYGNWWHPVAPVYWHHPVNYRSHFGFYWSPSIRLSTFFYFGGIHWHNRHVVVTRQPVRHYYRGPGVKRVYTKEYRRWDHDVNHRRIRYSNRVVHSAPARYNSLQHERKVVKTHERQLDYRDQPTRRVVDLRDRSHHQVKPVTPRATRENTVRGVEKHKQQLHRQLDKPVASQRYSRNVTKPEIRQRDVVPRPPKAVNRNPATPKNYKPADRQYAKPVAPAPQANRSQSNNYSKPVQRSYDKPVQRSYNKPAQRSYERPSASQRVERSSPRPPKSSER
ncbi:DUF3300 domain-containing protein [Alteromonas sp. H39]|uniref:DUF3300 domain-containing protein n=1 Tax=Alteromonas sp. H39 TaxID=3389876 RepID=UPI0039E085BC